MQRLRGLFEPERLESDSLIYIECRHCGTSVYVRPDECPACDRTEFATYELKGVEAGNSGFS